MALNLAQAGDETARQFQMIDDQIGDVGFSEGLALRRQKLEEMKGKTQAVEGYNKGQGASLVANVMDFKNRVPGQKPSDLISTGLSMEKAQQSLLSSSAAKELTALDLLTDFIEAGKKKVADEEALRMKKEQFEMDKLKFKAEYGIDPETGEKTEIMDDNSALVEAVDNGVLKIEDLTEKERAAYLKAKKLTGSPVTKSKTVSEDDQKIVSITTDLLDDNTNPITGYLRQAFGLGAKATEGKLQQLVGLLELAAAGKLKGQGAVSEREREILRNSIAALNLDKNGRSKLSDEDFKAEIRKIQAQFSGSSGKVTMSSPDGKSYEVDESEVAEAEQNGWRRE